MPHVCLIDQHPAAPFLFDAAARGGYRLTLLNQPGRAAPAGYACIDRTLNADLYEAEADAIALLAELHAADPFDGVLSNWDVALPFAARAASALGLRGLAPAVYETCRNKAAMRARLLAAGLNCPGFAEARDATAAVEASAALQFPVVVKPGAGFGSLGVRRCENVAEVRAAAADILALGAERPAIAHDGRPGGAGVLIEEYIDGREYVADTFSQDGVTHVLAIADKGFPQGPYFEESAYRAPADLPPHIAAAAADQVRRVLATIGLTDGPTHTEFRLRDGRDAMVFDIGARIGGSGFSHVVVEGTTGIDYAALLLANACGPVDCSALPRDPAPIAAAAVVAITVGQGGIVDHVSGLDRLAGDPRIVFAHCLVQPGARVRPLPAFDVYPAILGCRASDVAACDAIIAEILSTVRVVYRPETVA